MGNPASVGPCGGLPPVLRWRAFPLPRVAEPDNPMRSEDLETVHGAALFRRLSADQVHGFVRDSYLQRFPPNTELFREGTPADFLHVLLDGLVELSATHDGRTSVVEIVWPVDTFILAAVATDQPQLMTARTLEPSRIMMVPAANVRAAMAADPEVALVMIANLAQGYRHLVKQVKELKLRNATQRLGCYLLRLADQLGTDAFEIPFDNRVLASRLGMSLENLSRAFNALRDHGIKSARGQVRIDNRAALAEYARPDALIDGVDRYLTVPLER